MIQDPTSSGSTEIVHVVCNSATFASRVLKQSASALQHGLCDRVSVVALTEEGLPDHEEAFPRCDIYRVPLRTRRAPKRMVFQAVKYAEWTHRIAQWSRGRRIRVIHAHTISSLLPALWLRHVVKAPVLYDAHELESRQSIAPVRARLMAATERSLIRHVDAMITVSDSIADWYAANYRVERPVVVRNIPDVRVAAARTSSPLMREACGIPAGHLVFLYLGALFRGRRIEQFIRVFSRLPGHLHVVFMGYGELEPIVREAAARWPNVHFHPAVPPEELLLHTASADIGLHGGENISLSYFLSLPNKFFEYLAAGLPVLVPGWPEMERIVSEHGCGWIVAGEDDADWMAAITSLDANSIAAAAGRSRVAARQFSWAAEEPALLRVYETLLNAG